MGGWFGGRWGSEGPIGDLGPVTDPKKWGKGKGGMGDGIMGWSDGEQGPPKGSRWMPGVDVGLKPDFHGPKTISPDGGFYGGIDIGMLPGQASGDGMPETVRTALVRQWQYLRDKAENSKGIMREMLEAMAKIIDDRLTDKIADINEFILQGSESTLVIGENGYHYLHDHSSGKVWEIVWGPVTTVTPPKKSGGGGGLPSPDGESDQSPMNDPQLLLRMTEAADRQQNKPDVVPGVVDPVPIRGNDAAGRADGGELAAAGPAKAEAAWKFSGKKPGSEVTDPAEWQTFHGEETSGIARDVSLITDPAEPTAGIAATGDRSSGLSERGKAFFAQPMGQFLVQSIKATATH